MGTSIQGNFAGAVSVSDAITVPKSARLTAVVGGCYPSNTALFVLEVSTDSGATWTAVADGGTAGQDFPGEQYDVSGMMNAQVLNLVPLTRQTGDYRIRCAAFISGFASWTLSTP